MNEKSIFRFLVFEIWTFKILRIVWIFVSLRCTMFRNGFCNKFDNFAIFSFWNMVDFVLTFVVNWGRIHDLLNLSVRGGAWPLTPGAPPPGPGSFWIEFTFLKNIFFRAFLFFSDFCWGKQDDGLHMYIHRNIHHTGQEIIEVHRKFHRDSFIINILIRTISTIFLPMGRPVGTYWGGIWYIKHQRLCKLKIGKKLQDLIFC